MLKHGLETLSKKFAIVLIIGLMLFAAVPAAQAQDVYTGDPWEELAQYPGGGFPFFSGTWLGPNIGYDTGIYSVSSIWGGWFRYNVATNDFTDLDVMDYSGTDEHIQLPFDACIGRDEQGNVAFYLFPDRDSVGLGANNEIHKYLPDTDTPSAFDGPFYANGLKPTEWDNGLWGIDVVSGLTTTGENVCYISGGDNGGDWIGDSDILWAYYPGSNTIEKLGEFTHAENGFAAHASWYVPFVGEAGGICVAAGSGNNADNTDHVPVQATQCYDLASGEFNDVNADLPVPPLSENAVYGPADARGRDGKLWLIGGMPLPMNDVSLETWYFEPNGGAFGRGAWVAGPDLIYPHFLVDTTTLNGDIYLQGIDPVTIDSRTQRLPGQGVIENPDFDGDGIPNFADNCPLVPNPGQENVNDLDWIGDACDLCPYHFDPGQLDIDNDGLGDECDDDLDGDGVNNPVDDDQFDRFNCRDTDADGCDDCALRGRALPFSDGLDTDGDGLCNVGDIDDDGDGVIDISDSNTTDPFECRDSDNDDCDDCSVLGHWDPLNDGPDADQDGICDVDEIDDDNDNVWDGLDSEPGNPFGCGQDVDNDGCDDCALSGQHDPANDGPDNDGDGICDSGDDDIDGDGVVNNADSDPYNADVCSDADMDGCDDCSQLGVYSPANDGADFDRDGFCDLGDVDDDNDGMADENDANPLNSRICGDTDSDGCDDCQLTGSLSPRNDGPDIDGDGICDVTDSDRDGDTISNDLDTDPDDPFLCADRDGDGCDDCSEMGFPAPNNDGEDADRDGICDAGDTPRQEEEPDKKDKERGGYHSPCTHNMECDLGLVCSSDGFCTTEEESGMLMAGGKDGCIPQSNNSTGIPQASLLLLALGLLALRGRRNKQQD